MSPSADSPAETKQFGGLDLDFTHPGAAEAARSPGLHDVSEDALGSIAAANSLLDASHFGDFNFPYQDLQEDDPMGNFDHQHAADVFTNSQPPSITSIRGRQASVTSITVQTSRYGHRPNQRQHSMDDSDDGSPDSNHHGNNPLEEAMSDEFGLTNAGPGDGTDLGGKSKGEKADTAPAWSELKTKAGKERKRLPLACIACRRKKIRCSGEKPACKHCLRSRIPCVYKVTARKAAPRTDYMAMLDKRLKRMEERIIKIVPKSEQESVTANVTRAVVKPAIPGTLTTTKTSAKKRPAEEAFGHDLDHWARTPSKSKLDGPHKPSTLLVQEAEESKLLLEGGDALPSKEIQEHLAEVFFENLYGQAYHILHKPSYMRKLRAGALPPVLVLSVCAVSARFSNHPKLNTQPNFLRGEEWACAARDIITKRYEWPNITILTCLLILGLHEFGTCHGGRSWALGGQAIRMAFALQLHKDLDYDPLRMGGRAQLSFVDREIRRRTMWACFLMDRFNSSGTDRPTFIREETLKIPLPIKEKNFQLDIPGPTETLTGEVTDVVSADDGQVAVADAKQNMGVAAYMIKAISVWGRVISYLNQGGKELDPHPMWSPESEYTRLIKQTEDVLAGLPESLAYTPENLHTHETENMANQFLFLHIALQQNILFMNRFAVSSPKASSLHDVPKAFVTKAGARAFQAANRISELLKDAESHFITAPFTGYCAFLSSTVHIFGIFSGNAAMEATSKRNLAINVKFLSKMKRYWGMFHWMAENLREQYRTCADAHRQGTPATENSASPIFQYGDWFDRYPHGVSQHDFVDPASYRKKEKGDDAVLEQKPELHTVEEYFTTLSPQSQEGLVNGMGKPGQQQPKRKAMTRKGSNMSQRPDLHSLEPLQTEFSHHHAAAAAVAEQLQARAHHHRTFSGTGNRAAALGGQHSNGPTPLGMLTDLLRSAANGNAYHAALSPISPVTFSGHHHPHHPHSAAAAAAAASFFPPDPFSMPLAAHPHSRGLSQLDRQLVFGAYGNSIDPSLSSLAGWTHQDHGAGAGGDSSRGDSARRQSTAVNNNNSGSSNANNNSSNTTNPHASADAALQAAFGHGASSAWFMPFNMEPPEIGDLNVGGVGGGGLDGFASMFGNGGMATTPSGLGGMMHGGR